MGRMIRDEERGFHFTPVWVPSYPAPLRLWTSDISTIAGRRHSHFETDFRPLPISIATALFIPRTVASVHAVTPPLFATKRLSTSSLRWQFLGWRSPASRNPRLRLTTSPDEVRTPPTSPVNIHVAHPSLAVTTTTATPPAERLTEDSLKGNPECSDTPPHVAYSQTRCG